MTSNGVERSTIRSARGQDLLRSKLRRDVEPRLYLGLTTLLQSGSDFSGLAAASPRNAVPLAVPGKNRDHTQPGHSREGWEALWIRPLMDGCFHSQELRGGVDEETDQGEAGCDQVCAFGVYCYFVDISKLWLSEIGLSRSAKRVSSSTRLVSSTARADHVVPRCLDSAPLALSVSLESFLAARVRKDRSVVQQRSKTTAMSRTHRHRVLEKADSLCRFPIQRRTQPLEKSSELSDRETSIEETSWSSVSSADSPKNARRYYDEKQASLVIVTESFTSSCSGSKESDTFFSAPSWRTQSKYEDPLTLSTLSTTPKTTETPKATVVEAKSSSGSCENFGAVSSYDDFTTNTVTEETSSGSYGVTSLSATPLLASESATSELSSSGWTLSSVGSLNVISSRRSWIDSKENKSRLRGGKARSACTKESKDSCSQRSPETIPSSASLGSIYYADKLTTCLNGKCRVFAFDRVNCLCNEARSPADARCKKTRTGQGEKKAKDAYKKVPKSYTTPVEQPALLAKSCTSQRLIVNRRPLIEPPILNENHSWRYVGVLTHEEAPKAVRNKTDFRLYHQYIPGMDYTGVERLPLAVVYQSSKKRIYHWRVHTLGTFVEKRGKSVYNCEYYYIELGGPTCRSLNDLLDVYSDHAYNIDGHIENFFVYE
ncbi:hypothetical protein L596_013430 [Steinernema carpocapsae]|uniref:Uncharacterized protein n=1 Tax=Steinernema carpocapsae TaxID=34508 RepID=A0A4U5P104_STECR|nr:hypothetical protein L596_013430 [Steinernema carpocapsae]